MENFWKKENFWKRKTFEKKENFWKKGKLLKNGKLSEKRKLLKKLLKVSNKVYIHRGSDFRPGLCHHGVRALREASFGPSKKPQQPLLRQSSRWGHRLDRSRFDVFRLPSGPRNGVPVQKRSKKNIHCTYKAHDVSFLFQPKSPKNENSHDISFPFNPKSHRNEISHQVSFPFNQNHKQMKIPTKSLFFSTKITQKWTILPLRVWDSPLYTMMYLWFAKIIILLPDSASRPRSTEYPSGRGAGL